jgi:hypothetical protein
VLAAASTEEMGELSRQDPAIELDQAPIGIIAANSQR